MRISKAQAQENRDHIVETAAKLFRERGFDGISVADLMDAAGFTHGGFYNHFDSKEALSAEASEFAFRERAADLARAKSFEDLLASYIRRVHTVTPGQGCPAAALGGDAARQSDEVKRVFSAGIEGMIQTFEAALGEGDAADPATRRRQVINVLAKAVGAIVLSRAVPSTDRLAQEIVGACLAGALQDIEHIA
jgi:TetR/AcrR family transcriptional repressor of nem operon